MFFFFLFYSYIAKANAFNQPIYQIVSLKKSQRQEMGLSKKDKFKKVFFLSNSSKMKPLTGTMEINWLTFL